MTSRSAAHVEDTRRALIAAARHLFATVGFKATRTEEIVRNAGLTRGALYHHFRDKEDLFHAVYEEVAGEVDQLLIHRSAGVGPDNAWDLFQANSEVHLEAATKNADYRQIVLIDGPSVLGWDAWSERRGGALAKIAEYLHDGVREGSLEPLPAEAMAHLLSAVGTGAVMYVAQADDHVRARQDIEVCTERLLRGLVRPVPDSPAPHRPRSPKSSNANANANANATPRQPTRQGGH
jgi:AcrR family transcriptional regulator